MSAGQVRTTLAAAGWRMVSEHVAMRTSRREATTTSLILSDAPGSTGLPAVLVDPAWDSDELAAIAESLAAGGVTVAAGVATHAHHDHLLWHPGLGAAPRYGSAGTVTTADRRRSELVTVLGADFPAPLAALVGRLTVVTGRDLSWPGPPVRFAVHDAHCVGHTALWVHPDRVLIAGDMLSDVELPLAEDTGLAAYLAGLQSIRDWAEQAAVVIPGHGRPGTDGAARWAADERYVRTLLAGGDPVDGRIARPGMAAAHRTNLLLRP